MKVIEVGPLWDVVSAEEYDALPDALVSLVGEDVDREIVLDEINEIALEEFFERLDADGAELYLPAPAHPVVELDGRRFGSARSLLVRLTSLRSDLELDVPVDERTRALSKQRTIWKALWEAASTCLKTGQVVRVEEHW